MRYLIGIDNGVSFSSYISTDARVWAYVKKWKEDLQLAHDMFEKILDKTAENAK